MDRLAGLRDAQRSIDTAADCEHTRVWMASAEGTNRELHCIIFICEERTVPMPARIFPRSRESHNSPQPCSAQEEDSSAISQAEHWKWD
eukprot:7974314-Karenia_brevis.AAC.1